ncbi:type I secretion system permease/ATPase [Pseudoruegeria sp. HB172150]|uniref:type I secretion system permease/ATPase n=1 Tax=Pseudoruegeria sp. HB172150 TaxID=2721164 RepID=UPI00155732A3|nr:type I secretion system permease/ATPase [Pseudoruegeria sp. HB172150]
MSRSGQPIGKIELWRALLPGVGLLGWIFVFSVFANLLMLTGPLYMLQIYDRVLSSQSVETLIALSVLVAGLYALMALFDYARGRLMARVGARFQSKLDRRVFEASLQGGQGAKERNDAASALRDLDAIQRLFVSPVLITIMDLPWTPVFLVLMFFFHPMIGWLAVTGGAILILLTLANHAITARRTRQAAFAAQQSHDMAAEVRMGEEVVLTQGMRPVVTERWRRQRVDGLARGIGANDWTGSFTSVTRAFRLLLQSAVLGLGAYYTLQGELTGGAMIAGSILLGRALAPIEQALGGWAVLQRARQGWKSLGGFLAKHPPEPQRTELPVPEANLTVKNLSVLAPGGRMPVLRGVNFQLMPGQAIGVIGPSGSGKSTLARVLLGYWPVTAGEVRLGGPTLDQYGADALGRHIGYLPQNVRLFSGTIAQNIARMADKPDSAAVVRAAKAARAHDIITRLPEGYDTVLKANDLQLSGGQCQRIALARALYGDPRLLILDEPNSALDAEGSDALNEAVRSFKERGRGVIIMTHRPNAIAECDLLLVLDNGLVTSFGPRDVVMRRMLKNADTVQKTLRSLPGGAQT